MPEYQKPESKSKKKLGSQAKNGELIAQVAGCTACIALIAGNTCYVANVGDSKCVIAKKTSSGKYKALVMNKEAKPDNEEEK